MEEINISYLETYSRKPGLCLSSLWSPNWIWHCIPAKIQAFSWVTGCVPSRIASLAWTYKRDNCTGSRLSIFWSEKKNFLRSSTVSDSSIPCSLNVLLGSIQFTGRTKSYFTTWRGFVICNAEIDLERNINFNNIQWRVWLN